MRFLLLTLILCAVAQTQTSQSPTFEVASVKPQPWTGPGAGAVGVFIRGNTLTAEHCDLNSLVEFAYNLKDFQLSGGPSWTTHGKLAESTLFQVIGKPADGQTPSTDQFRQMLQALLADRFQLKIHHVSKDLPAYNLVQDKGGVKLKESAPDTQFSMHTESWGKTHSGLRITAANTTIQRLVDAQLGGYTGRPTFDKTGLTASYDLRLEWIQSSDPDASLEGPSLFTAVREQLGLRLESTTAPFDTVVIDRAEKPSEN